MFCVTGIGYSTFLLISLFRLFRLFRCALGQLSHLELSTAGPRYQRSFCLDGNPVIQCYFTKNGQESCQLLAEA